MQSSSVLFATGVSHVCSTTCPPEPVTDSNHAFPIAFHTFLRSGALVENITVFCLGAHRFAYPRCTLGPNPSNSGLCPCQFSWPRLGHTFDSTMRLGTLSTFMFFCRSRACFRTSNNDSVFSSNVQPASSIVSIHSRFVQAMPVSPARKCGLPVQVFSLES